MNLNAQTIDCTFMPDFGPDGNCELEEYTVGCEDICLQGGQKNCRADAFFCSTITIDLTCLGEPPCTDATVGTQVFQGCGNTATSNIVYYFGGMCVEASDGVINIGSPTGTTASIVVCSSSATQSFGGGFSYECPPCECPTEPECIDGNRRRTYTGECDENGECIFAEVLIGCLSPPACVNGEIITMESDGNCGCREVRTPVPCNEGTVCDGMGNFVTTTLNPETCECETATAVIDCNEGTVCDGNGNLVTTVLDAANCECDVFTAPIDCNVGEVCDGGNIITTTFDAANCECDVITVAIDCNEEVVCDGNGRLIRFRLDEANCECIEEDVPNPCTTDDPCKAASINPATCECEIVDSELGCGSTIPVTFRSCNDGVGCTINDQEGVNECGEVCVPCRGTERCRPFTCDDGNPCTFNDRVMIGCDGSVCEPCTGTMEVADKDGDGARDCEDECPHNPNKSVAGDCGCDVDDDDIDGDGVSDCLDECPDNPFTSSKGSCGRCDAPGIETVELVNVRDCNDNGTGDNSADDFFYADIRVIFNFPPVLGGVDITGPVNVYYNFENGNTDRIIMIRNQRIKADGKPIAITAAYRGNEECNACVHVGEAPPSCSSVDCQHPDYSIPAPIAGGECIVDITLDKISKCNDNRTGSYENDDFVRANVTVHLNKLPSRGILKLGGMAAGQIDLSNISGKEYTFRYTQLNFNQDDYIIAKIVDKYNNSDVLCSYNERAFECDPCTVVAQSRVADYTTFNAFKFARSVEVEWASNEIYKTASYTIEKSIDGTNFDVMTSVQGEDIDKDDAYFTGIDNTPVFGDNFYRLKQVLVDGEIEYSNMKLVQFGIDLNAISFFPNPAEDALYIDLDEYAGKTGHLIISNQFGQVMEEIDLDEIPADLIQVNLATYTNGVYIIRTKVNNSKYVAKKLVVNKMY